MQRLILKSVALAVLSGLFSNVFSCTDFSLQASDGTNIVTRTLEFAQQLQSRLMTSPRQRMFAYQAPNGKPAMTWKSQYGYVFLDALHSGIVMDGMNEQGLSFEYLYLPNETQYQTVPQGEESHGLPYYAFGDWALGNFKTVAQVKKALENTYVFQQKLQSFGQVIFPVHAILHDATGQSIVVEFVGGKMHVYDNKLGVTTNSPTYDWQLTNLRNYINLSPMSPAKVQAQGETYFATGQGSGMFGLPGDASPPSRFVKIAMLKATALPVSNASDLLVLAQHMVDNVDIPKGFVRGKEGNSVAIDYTQWTVFKNLTNKVFYYKTYDNPTLQSVDLTKIDFSPNAKRLSMPIDTPNSIKDTTDQFLASVN